MRTLLVKPLLTDQLELLNWTTNSNWTFVIAHRMVSWRARDTVTLRLSIRMLLRTNFPFSIASLPFRKSSIYTHGAFRYSRQMETRWIFNETKMVDCWVMKRCSNEAIDSNTLNSDSQPMWTIRTLLLNKGQPAIVLVHTVPTCAIEAQYAFLQKESKLQSRYCVQM